MKQSEAVKILIALRASVMAFRSHLQEHNGFTIGDGSAEDRLYAHMYSWIIGPGSILPVLDDLIDKASRPGGVLDPFAVYNLLYIANETPALNLLHIAKTNEHMMNPSDFPVVGILTDGWIPEEHNHAN